MCPVCGSRFPDDVRECPSDGAVTYRVHAADDLVGRRIDGRFEVLERIGSGGMGTVYRARQVSTDRMVAVKVLRSEFLDDESALRRFFREARALSRLTSADSMADAAARDKGLAARVTPPAPGTSGSSRRG